MGTIKKLAGAAIFAALFSIFAFGQTSVPATGGRIGLINPGMFGDEKAGITKYKAGAAAVDAGMENINSQIRALNAKFQTAKTEFETLQKAGNQAGMKTKGDEIQTIQTNLKRLQEDGKVQYNKVYSQIMSPIVNDVIKVLNEYAKQKGYAVILDGAKLEQADILVGFDDRYDVTKDFIAFYNARPATAAVPK